MLDPYAKAFAGSFHWHDALYGYRIGDPREDLSFDERDSAPYIPRCVVVDTSFDWENDRLLDVPWSETVIYELHVKGFTKMHPRIPEHLRGTYAGLASEPAIAHLKKLGVTAVELLPVHHHVDERALVDRGLTNYWGYNTIGFFAPDSRFSSSGDSGQQVREFKQMVKALHKAGIEVILDVVYNHSGEGNHLGPTISFRGIDNPSYYHAVPNQPRYYMDFSGTGNSLDISQTSVMKLVMDSLRYWVLEMHVDGFRFDLAAALARKSDGEGRLSTFFDIVHQDPVISQVKLIAEPWDLGQDGYQIGKFPPLWAEWNGKYRDVIRRFWRGDPCLTYEMAHRMSGSSDLFGDKGRCPCSSINYVTCHDGFTLNDLVSYNTKHNFLGSMPVEDGCEENISWNCGVEGQTKDSGIRAFREKQKRNFLATFLLSQGVPMICAGDEIGRTQLGNNNAYCQDNEISWMDWRMDDEKSALLEYVEKLISLRRAHPVFRRHKFFGVTRAGVPQASFFSHSGAELDVTNANQSPYLRSFAMLLNGDAIGDSDATGNEIRDNTFLMLFNAAAQAVEFNLPHPDYNWQPLLTSGSVQPDLDHPPQDMTRYRLDGYSFALLKRCK